MREIKMKGKKRKLQEAEIMQGAEYIKKNQRNKK